MDGASPVDVIVFMLALIVNLWALWRRPDWVAGTLLVAMLASIPIGQTVPVPDVVGVLALLDAIVALIMVLVWTRWRSRRAQLVGFLSLIRAGGAFLMSVTAGQIDWIVFAVCQNAFYFLQLMIAGGWFDRVVAFVDRLDPGSVALRGQRHPSHGEG